MPNISMVTFAGQTVTPQDDALIYESALGDGGIIYGAEVTLKSANTLHISAGHGVIAGRKFTVYESDIQIVLSSSGVLLGRLYIHMDLSNASDPIEILTETGSSLTPLVQDENVNIVNGVFEFNLATFNVSESTISDLRNIYPKIQYANSGSFIYVTAISPSLIGQEVQITDGTDIIYAIFDADGVAELKNVFMTGTLQITATDGTYTAGTTIEVPYYGTYNATLSFWLATLSITTSSSELYNQPITIKNSDDEVVGTTTFNSVGAASFIVNGPDIYTLSVVYGGNTFTATVNVTAQTTYNVDISMTPEGAIVTPTDDIQIWLRCADIWNKSYTTISEVLADASTLQALVASNNAADYMSRSTTWATDVTADSSAMSYIGLNDYCADKLLENLTWLNAICDSAYFESVLNVKVPTMTSDTTPSGTVIYSGQQSGQRAYQAFDKNTNTPWVSNSPGSPGAYIGYIFETEVNIKKMVATQGFARNLTTKFQASQDGSTWEDLSGEFTIPTENNYTVTFIKENNTKYARYRYYIAALRSEGVTYGAEADEVQFYGRA